jgi:hypothetical protein
MMQRVLAFSTYALWALFACGDGGSAMGDTGPALDSSTADAATDAALDSPTADATSDAVPDSAPPDTAESGDSAPPDADDASDAETDTGAASCGPLPACPTGETCWGEGCSCLAEIDGNSYFRSLSSKSAAASATPAPPASTTRSTAGAKTNSPSSVATRHPTSS